MAKSTPDFEDFTGLSIGDWIAVTGVVMMTRRGELSVRVDAWDVLAAAQRPFPDKWHGISDPDTRYRQRYIDMWVTEEARDAFAKRSQIVDFFRCIIKHSLFVYEFPQFLQLTIDEINLSVQVFSVKH